MKASDRNNHVGHRLRVLNNMIRRHVDNSCTKKQIDDITGTNGWIIAYMARNSDHPVYQRDIEREEVLEDEFDKDGIERKEREAQIEFRREMRQERAIERSERNEAMRGMSREKRRDEMKEDRRTWEKWFKEEKRRYEKSKEP